MVPKSDAVKRLGGDPNPVLSVFRYSAPAEFRVGEPTEMTHDGGSGLRPFFLMTILTRRDAITTAGEVTGPSVLASTTGCEKSSSPSTSAADSSGGSKSVGNE